MSSLYLQVLGCYISDTARSITMQHAVMVHSRDLMRLMVCAMASMVAAGPAYPGYSTSTHGISLTRNSAGATITVEVGAEGLFRLGVAFSVSPTDPTPISSPSLDPTRVMPPFTPTTRDPGFVGIKTSYGSLLANGTGAFVLLDEAGGVLVSGDEPLHSDVSGNGTISYNVRNLSVRDPPTPHLHPPHFPRASRQQYPHRLTTAIGRACRAPLWMRSG